MPAFHSKYIVSNFCYFYVQYYWLAYKKITVYRGYQDYLE